MHSPRGAAAARRPVGTSFFDYTFIATQALQEAMIGTHPEEGAPPSQLAWRGDAPSLKSMSPDEKRVSICSILRRRTADN